VAGFVAGPAMTVVAMPLTAVLVLHSSTPQHGASPASAVKNPSSSGSVMRGLA
jgi:hypothetical protein